MGCREVRGQPLPLGGWGAGSLSAARVWAEGYGWGWKTAGDPPAPTGSGGPGAKGPGNPGPFLSPQPPPLAPNTPAREMRPRMLPVFFGEGIAVNPEPTHEIR